LFILSRSSSQTVHLAGLYLFARAASFGVGRGWIYLELKAGFSGRHGNCEHADLEIENKGGVRCDQTLFGNSRQLG
jgi:hypothetical protein